MDPLKLQRSIFRRLLQERPNVADGMQLVFDLVEPARLGQSWRSCRDINWKSGLEAWVEWMRSAVSLDAFPSAVELLWFESPSELNVACTSASAYEKLDPTTDSFGTDARALWPSGLDGSSYRQATHELPELQEAWVRAGWWDQTDMDIAEPLSLTVYAVSHSYVALLILEGLPLTGLLDRSEVHVGVGVTTGWHDGDTDAVGVLKVQGWEPLKVKKSKRTVGPEELDPERGAFDVEKYLEAGGDVERRVGPQGETILMRSRFQSTSTISKILKKGAQVDALDAEGSSVLHSFGAADPRILKLLLDAGADPNRVNAKGHSVLGRVLRDGRCTLDRVLTLVNAGAHLEPHEEPISILAAHGIYNASRRSAISQLLRYWADHGGDPNHVGHDGRTPLWICLEAHVKELALHLEHLRGNPGPSGFWDHKHDQVALMLLEVGADPNARLRSSTCVLIPSDATPLMVQRYDDDTLVRALLKTGADPHATSSEGETALDYARRAASDPSRIDSVGAATVVKVLERAMRRRH